MQKELDELYENALNHESEMATAYGQATRVRENIEKIIILNDNVAPANAEV